MARPLPDPTGGFGDDAGKLLLRLVLGILILLHGLAKVSGGVDGILGMVGKMGLPPQLGYLVYVGEILAPLLLIAGAWTRAAALVIVINMLVAIGMAHMGELLQLGRSGGWALELQGMFLFTALAISLLGAGRFSAAGEDGRWN